MSEEKSPRRLVLDTSVAVKFHLLEDNQEEIEALEAAIGDRRVELRAPGTLLPEAFNALWQRHRRGELSRGEVSEAWEVISTIPLSLYGPEDLIPRAVEITFESGAIIYDALFLALAEETGTVMVTADDKLLRTLKGTSYGDLARSLAEISVLLR